MAQYAVLIYAHDSATTSVHDSAATRASDAVVTSEQHAADLAASGAMLLAFELTPSDMATSIRGDSVTDGPFIDAKEVVAGFYVIEAPDLDAALEIARQNPVVHQGGGVEVRPIADGGVVTANLPAAG